MSRILYSIIVPVYNAEKYLSNCIDSVLEQTYSNFELILVDDGSKDKSSEILESYQKKDSRIKVIEKENGGQLRARLDAIKVSCGDYVLSLDSDDYWQNTLLERVNQSIMQNESDIVIFDFAIVDNNGIVKKNKYFKNTSELVIDKYDYLIQWSKDTNLNAIWSKVFRKRIFSWNSSNERDSVKSGEDLMMNISLIQSANTITYIPEILYFYRSNQEGISSNFKESKIKDLLISRSEFHDYLDSYCSGDINQNSSISTFTIIAGTVAALLQSENQNKEQLLSLIVDSKLYRSLDKTVINKINNFRLIVLLKLLNRRRFTTLRIYEKLVCLVSQLRR